MKAKTLKLAALPLILATAGMGATPQILPTHQTQTQNQRINEALQTNPQTVRQGRPTALNPTGGYTEYFENSRSPKEYGQWLQANRKQKWVKSKKH